MRVDSPSSAAEEIHRCPDCGWHKRTGTVVPADQVDRRYPESIHCTYWNGRDTCEEARARWIIGAVLES